MCLFEPDFSLCACSNDAAEEAEVKNYLISNYWYRYLGGNYEMEELYEFNNDGTYESHLLHSVSLLDMHFAGTYKINTRKKTITFYNEDGEEKYVWTYSLYENSMKLYNSDAREYTTIRK